jgi:hypothetical protein
VSTSSSSSTVLIELNSNAKCTVVISKGAGQPPMPSDEPEMEGQSPIGIVTRFNNPSIQGFY